jgi:hypothetical protein
MMRKTVVSYFAIFAIACALCTMSCSEVTDIGVDLLSDDQIGISYTDTLKIESLTVRQDSVLSPNYKNYELAYPVGNFTDPVFGQTNASAYLQFFPGNYYSVSKLKGAVVDSVILSLKYDTASVGNITDTRSIEVYRMNAELTSQDHFTNKTFGYDAAPLASKTFVPRIKNVKADSVNILNYNKSDTVTLPADRITLGAHLRISLPKTLGQEILALDSTKLNTDAEFAKIFRGLYLKPTSKDNGMIGFLLSQYSTTSVTYNILTNITIYYKDNTNKKNTMTLYSSINPRNTNYTQAVKSSNFIVSPSNLIKQASNNQAISDTILYLQGLSGPDVRIKIPQLKSLGGKNLIVNKAELELYAKGNEAGYNLPPQLVLRKKNIGVVSNDVVDDVELSYYTSKVLLAFGGKPEKVTVNGETVWRYRFNLSAYAQKMIDNAATTGDTFYMALENKSSKAYRGIFYGAKHPKFPMKLKLYTTKI